MSNIFNKLKVKKVLSSLLAFSIVLMMVPALSLSSLAAAGDITITTQPSPTSQTIFYGQTVAYSCNATRASGGLGNSGPYYQWRLDGSDVGSETTSSNSYTTSATLAAGDHTIYCYVRSKNLLGSTVGATKNTDTVNVKVLPIDIAQYTVTVTGGAVYDGTAHNPTSVTVEYGGYTLTEGTHYTYATTDNVNAGNATVTVSGAGLLSGTSGTGSFIITPAPGVFPAGLEYDVNYVTGLTVADAIGGVSGLAATNPAQQLYVGDGQVIAGTHTDPSGNYASASGTFIVNVKKGTPSYTVTIADWNYGQAAKTPVVIGNVGGTEAYLYTGGPGGTYSSSTPPTTPGNYTLSVDVGESANFLAGSASTTFTINKADQAPLIVDGLDTLYERGTLPFDVTLSTTGGSGTGVVTFFVSGPATINGNTLTVTGIGTVTVMASKAADENYRVESGTGMATVTDIDAPTGAIAIGTNSWNSFFNTVTFGMFFKETKQVTITAADNAPGAVTVSYFVSDAEVAVGDLAGLAWVAGNTFSVNPNDKYVLYAKLEDASGNIAYINSDGIVIYTDSTFAGVELGYTKTSGDQNITIDFNGNTINEIKNGTYTLVEGTDYTVTATGITLSGTYLDSLAASTTAYELVVSFNPLGEEYPDTPAAGSEAPGEVNIDITVSKAPAIVATAPTASTVWKGDTLSTSVLSDGVASVPGTFQWVDGTVAVPADGEFDWVFIPDDEDTYERVTGKADVATVDKTALLKLIDDAQGKIDGAVVGDADGEYKQNLYDALEDAIADSKALTDAAPTTQADVTAMTEKLQKAVDEFIPNVVKKEESSSKNDDSKNDDSSDDSAAGEGSKKGGEGAPGTGTASIAGAMAILALSGAAIVVLKKRK